MSGAVKIAFGSLAGSKGSALVVFVGADMKPAPAVTAQFGDLEPLIRAAAKASNFRAAQRTALDILAPAGLDASRLVAVGIAPGKDNAPVDFITLGGFTFGKVSGAKRVEVAFEAPSGMWDGSAAADFALGLRLRAYRFDKYKTRKKESEDNGVEAPDFVIGSGHVAAARVAAQERFAIAEGVELARNLVNEPPNVLFPLAFADRAQALEKLGVDVEILDEKAMGKLGMNALLAVGRGSARESRLVAMRWNGARSKRTKPVAVVGKGVCFELRRDLDQALGRYGGYEGRHGWRSLCCRTHARPRRAQSESQRGRRGRLGREHARWRCDPAGGYHHLDVGSDDRDRQHGRRRPARSGRRALVRPGDLFPARDHRSCDADRRHHRRAR